MRHGDPARPALIDEQVKIKKSRAKWVVIGALSVPPAAVFAPVAWTLPGFCAVMVCVLEHKLADNEGKLGDPPRRDYEIRTRPRRRNFRPDVLGSTAVGRHTAEATLADLRAGASLRAAVRAHERAEGAAQVGARRLRSERQREMRQFLLRAADEREAASAPLMRLGDTWKELSSEIQFRSLTARELSNELERRDGRVDLLATLGPKGLRSLEATALSFTRGSMRVDAHEGEIELSEIMDPGAELRNAIVDVERATLKTAALFRQNARR